MNREQYLKSQNPITHRTYYEQFVTDDIIKSVAKAFGYDLVKHDYPFNTIPLVRWDKLVGHVIWNPTTFKLYDDTITLSGQVCILKAAGRMIKEANDDNT